MGLEGWRRSWRNAVCPQLSTAALESLRDALEADDAALIQAETVAPDPERPADIEWHDAPVWAACAIGFCAWRAYGCLTVGAVERFFSDLLEEADRKADEAHAADPFVGWFDAQPREVVFRELLAEVELTLESRRARLAAPRPTVESGRYAELREMEAVAPC